jgi:hypothetical protein
MDGNAKGNMRLVDKGHTSFLQLEVPFLSMKDMSWVTILFLRRMARESLLRRIARESLLS